MGTIGTHIHTPSDRSTDDRLEQTPKKDPSDNQLRETSKSTRAPHFDLLSSSLETMSTGLANIYAPHVACDRLEDRIDYGKIGGSKTNRLQSSR
jgi:hypothetical protein